MRIIMHRQHSSMQAMRFTFAWFAALLSLSLSLTLSLTLSGTLNLVAAAPATSSYVQVLADMDLCPGATGVYVDDSGFVIASCTNEDASVLLIDPTRTGSAPIILANGTICSSANDVIRNSINGVVYVACTSGVISVTPSSSSSSDFSNFQLSEVLNSTLCVNAETLDITQDGRYLTTGCTDGVIRVDLITSVITHIMNGDQCPYAGSVVSYWETGVEYILATCVNSIFRKNLSNGKISQINNVDQCGSPSSIMRDSSSGTLYFSCTDTGLFKLEHDSINNSNSSAGLSIMIASYRQCPFPRQVWYDSKTNVTFGVCADGDVIAVTSDSSITPIVSFVLCNTGQSIVVTEEALVLGCYSSGVLRISAATISVAASYSVCQSPSSVLFELESGDLVSTCTNGLISVANNEITFVANETQCRASVSVIQDPVSGQILAACGFSHGVIAINASSNAVTTVFHDPDANCDALNLFEDVISGVLYLTCNAGGFARYNMSSGDLKMLMSDELCSSISYMASIDTVFAMCQSGLKAISNNRTSALLANYSTNIGNSVFVLGDRLFVTFSASASSVLMIQGTDLTNITAVVTGDICTNAYDISQSKVTGALLVACAGGTSSVISIDPQTLQVTRLVSSDACFSARSVTQDAITGTLGIACYAAGVLLAATNYRCTPGTNWRAGACVPCEAQSYRSASDLRPLSQCRLCDPGYVAPVAGSATCTACAPGSYDSKKTCLLCPLGKYQPSSGSTSCIDCGIGSYNIYPGSTACTLCDPGFYASINGSVSCTPCGRGSASSAIGLTHACDGCPAGSYQNGVGKTICIDCEPHTYAERDNSTSCTRCASQVNAERTTCTVVTCDANSEFNEVTNQCQLCTLSKYSSQGGLCSDCVINTYTPAAGSGCASCTGIEGLECAGGLASVAPGYWAFLSDQATWSATPGVGPLYPLYQTAPCQFCQGSLLQLDAAHVNVTIEYCAHPRLNSVNNTLCAQCEPGYLAWGDSCVTCNQVNGGLAFAYFVFSFALVIFLLTSSSSTSSAASTSIFLFFIQTAALELGPIVKFLNFIQIVANLDPKSAATCLAPWSAYDQTLFALLIPLILIGELGIIAVIHFAMHRWLEEHPVAAANRWHSSLANRLRRFSLSDYHVGVVSIFLFYYTQVATACLKYLHCTQVGPENLNFSAPTIDCRSGEYKRYLVPVVLALIVYVIGFPIYAFVNLWRHRESLYLPSDSDVLRSSPTIASFMARWSPFYRMYHPRAYFWQCWVLLRRASFVITSVLLLQEPSKRFMVFNFLHVASLLLHQYVRPYEESRLNDIETTSYALLICVSLLLVGYSPPYPTSVQAMLFILIVPPTALMLGFILAQRFNRWKQQARNKPEENRSRVQHSESKVNNGAAASGIQASEDSYNSSSAESGAAAAVIEMHSVAIPTSGSGRSTIDRINDPILLPDAQESDQQQL